jgi:hypothetical protein
MLRFSRSKPDRMAGIQLKRARLQISGQKLTKVVLSMRLQLIYFPSVSLKSICFKNVCTSCVG